MSKRDHKATILIFSSSHLCRNPRVVKEATTLGEAGYDVTVLTVSNSTRFEEQDARLISGLPFRRVVLEQASKTTTGKFRGILSRGNTWVARAALRRFRFESPAALGPARLLLRMAFALPADLTIAHTEIPLWASRSLIRAGRRVAVDFEDWYSEDLLPAERRTRPLKLLREAESFAMCHAVYCSATSASMANALATMYGTRRPVVIRNSFPLPARWRTPQENDNALPSLVWFSQTIGPGRGLEGFLAGWVQAQAAPHVYLLGDPCPGYRESLLAQVPPERRKLISFLPPVPPDELPGELANFDIGLALEQRSPASRDLTITNKLFQYVAAGLAVIATDTAGQREFMSASPDVGLLLTDGSPAAIACALETLGDRPRLTRMQHAARHAAEREHCWEREAPRLLEAVAGALETQRPST